MSLAQVIFTTLKPPMTLRHHTQPFLPTLNQPHHNLLLCTIASKKATSGKSYIYSHNRKMHSFIVRSPTPKMNTPMLPNSTLTIRTVLPSTRPMSFLTCNLFFYNEATTQFLTSAPACITLHNDLFPT